MIEGIEKERIKEIEGDEYRLNHSISIDP